MQESNKKNDEKNIWIDDGLMKNSEFVQTDQANKDTTGISSIGAISITSFIFAVSVLFSSVGLVLSLIAVIKAARQRGKQKKVKGFFLATVSLILSIIILCSSIVIPVVFREDIAAAMDEYGVIQSIEEVLHIELTKGQMELCQQIERCISANEIDEAVNLSSQIQGSLKTDEKRLVMDALINRINNRMKVFQKDFGSTKSLISDDVIQEVWKYKRIIANIGITSADNTNVLNYLDKVYDFKNYNKYNDYWAYFCEVTDDWDDANRYWEYACDSYSDSVKYQHLAKAKNYFSQCLSAAYDYSASSFGIVETRAFLQIYIDRINYYYETGSDMSFDYSVVYEYESITEEFIGKAEEFFDKVDALPTSVYFN